MSWGIYVVGTKDAVRAELVTQFDKVAKQYEGTEEAKDVLSVKERALAMVDGFTPEEFRNGLKVEANGSRYSGYANFKLDVSHIRVTV